MKSQSEYKKALDIEFSLPIRDLIERPISKTLPKNFLDFNVSSFSDINSLLECTISFAKNEFFLKKAEKNRNIEFVLVSKNLKNINKSEKMILTDEPEFLFHKLRNHYLKIKKEIINLPTSFICEGLKCNNVKTIPKNGVYIGKDVEIGTDCDILEGTLIGDNTKIHNKVSLGIEDLMVYRGNQKLKRHIQHDKLLEIKNDCVVYNGTSIAKGLYGRDTNISENCEIGINCVIGHGVYLGKNSTICSQSSVGGFSSIGESSYLGLSSTVINRVKIPSKTKLAAGAVVLKSFSRDNTTIIGNPGKVLKI